MSYSKSTKLDFTGQVFSIGIDTHKTNWKVTIRNNNLELKTFSMNPSVKQLHTYLHKNYPNGKFRSVYEAGFCGFWIDRELRKLGIDNIIVNPSDVPTTDKEKKNKSDGIDSRKMSRERENNSLKGIFVPTEEQESLRCLHRLYQQSTKRVTQLKNRIKGYIHFVGIQIPAEYESSSWSAKYLMYLSGIETLLPTHKYVLDSHIDELKHARKEKLRILKEIRRISKDNTIIQLLKTIPGVGQLMSFALYSELTDITRFKDLDNLASFVGLVPTVRSSAEKESVHGITKRHCKHLRSDLIESAWVAIRNDPALLQAYNHLRTRKNAQEAIVRIAKKLLNRIRYVWKNEKEYVKAIIE